MYTGTHAALAREYLDSRRSTTLRACRSAWYWWGMGSTPAKRHTKGEVKDWIRARYPNEIWH